MSNETSARIEGESGEQMWRELTADEIKFGDMPINVRCLDCKNAGGFHYATCKDTSRYEVPKVGEGGLSDEEVVKQKYPDAEEAVGGAIYTKSCDFGFDRIGLSWADARERIEAKPEPLPNTEIIQSATICEHGYYNNNCCPKCHNIPVTGPLPNTPSSRLDCYCNKITCPVCYPPSPITAPKVVDSKGEQDWSPLREDTVVFRYDGLEAITQACGLLDVIKQEWAEMWTDHDQAVREGLSRILSTSVEEQDGEQEPAEPKHRWAGMQEANDWCIGSCSCGWVYQLPYSGCGHLPALLGYWSDHVVEVFKAESVAPPSLPKQTPMKDDGAIGEIRRHLTETAIACGKRKGHDRPDINDLYSAAISIIASRAAAPVGPARTDLEKGLLNALYEVMPYLKETSRYKLLAPICHEALRLAGDDWAAPVALPTHREVERTIADDDYVGLRCSCGRIFVGLGDEALASSRASFEAHLPEKEGKR